VCVTGLTEGGEKENFSTRARFVDPYCWVVNFVVDVEQEL
jgi:hypothetical protein